ncbi:hypothetical protein GOQ27_13995 [Clostridium sp. D2Q-11]|uniref:Uncharacterized protein n=1 Tax=Anaeromonas frigoriresistens TaxID=2683708 RepID=A0A942V459_9FIRM|nr:hypothetical protein [Anaeromonas frigoriresistens]MBS4539582.1 hypothetical protein [Anaeromonas frigoriresistens]
MKKKILILVLIFIVFSILSQFGKKKIEGGLVDYLKSKHSIEIEFDEVYMRKPSKILNKDERSDLNKRDVENLIKYLNSLTVKEAGEIEGEDNLPIEEIWIKSSEGYDEISINIASKNQFLIIVSTLEEEYDKDKKVNKLYNDSKFYWYEVIDENIDFKLLNELYE